MPVEVDLFQVAWWWLLISGAAAGGTVLLKKERKGMASPVARFAGLTALCFVAPVTVIVFMVLDAIDDDEEGTD